MIRKYRYGNPFPTGAVACEIAAEKKEQTAFRLNAEGEFTLALAPEDCVYGLPVRQRTGRFKCSAERETENRCMR